MKVGLGGGNDRNFLDGRTVVMGMQVELVAATNTALRSKESRTIGPHPQFLTSGKSASLIRQLPYFAVSPLPRSAIVW